MVAKYSIPFGGRFGSLVILAEAPKRNKYHRRVYAQCDCGNLCDLNLPDIKGGKTLSCGCGRIKHAHAVGGVITPTYAVWRGMKDRCRNPKSRAYPDYGGRGIDVCDRWFDSFQNFLADMGGRPSSRHTIDRIDNDSGYEPGNCRWTTRRVQQNNRRSTFMIEYKGVSKSVSEWAEERGMILDTLYNRIKRHGWTAEKAIETPCLRRSHFA